MNKMEKQVFSTRKNNNEKKTLILADNLYGTDILLIPMIMCLYINRSSGL